MGNSKTADYEILASFYHHLMRSVNYKLWAEYIESIVRDHLPKRASVLELGAGTGKFAEYFKKYFKNIIISDLSYPMLAAHSYKSLIKICCDMTALPFKNKYDLIYSNFDSVNYLTSRKKMVKCFSEVKNILTEDGIFTFDVSLEKNSLKHVRRSNRKGKYNKIKYEQNSFYDHEKKIHKNIFRINLGDSKLFTEIHKQKIYTFDEYFFMIDKAGLYAIECYEAFSNETGNRDSERLQFIVKRK